MSISLRTLRIGAYLSAILTGAGAGLLTSEASPVVGFGYGMATTVTLVGAVGIIWGRKLFDSLILVAMIGGGLMSIGTLPGYVVLVAAAGFAIADEMRAWRRLTEYIPLAGAAGVWVGDLVAQSWRGTKAVGEYLCGGNRQELEELAQRAAEIQAAIFEAAGEEVATQTLAANQRELVGLH